MTTDLYSVASFCARSSLISGTPSEWTQRAAQEHSRLATGHPPDALDGRDGAELGVLTVDTGNNQDLGLARGGRPDTREGSQVGRLGLRGLHRRPGLIVGKVEGDDHAGQYNVVVQREYG
jgi:hypothetical protein